MELADANGDPLLFKVEIRGKNETLLTLLKDKLQDHYWSFDSTAFPDGNYVVRVSATDAPGNTPADALTSSLESESFIIDNTPADIVNLSSAKSGGKWLVKFTAKDALSWIDKAEYSVNGGDWTILDPVNKVTDSQMLDYQLPAEEGQSISIRVFDESDNVVTKQLVVR